MQTDPTQHDEIRNENRELAARRWGGRRPGAGAKPRTQTLRDIDRAARLHDIAEHPYAQLAFADRSALEMMHLCAMHLVEAKDYKAAGRIFDKLHRYTTGEGAPEQPRIAPDTRYVLAVEDVPESPEPALAPDRDQPEPVAADAQVADAAPEAIALDDATPPPGTTAPTAADIDAEIRRRSGDPRHPAVERNFDIAISTSSSAPRSPPVRTAA